MVGTDRSIAIADVAKASYRPVGPTTKFGIGLDASGSSDVPPTFPNGCHVCEVEIDPETGVVDIDRYAVVDDVGRVINPMICHGQIEGALAQGIGQALMESVAFDRESGQMLSASFTDYAMPRAADLPHHYEPRLHRRSGKDQPARRERHRRSGLRRRAARGDERHPRRVASAGRLASRYAGDPAPRLGSFTEREALAFHADGVPRSGGGPRRLWRADTRRSPAAAPHPKQPAR